MLSIAITTQNAFYELGLISLVKKYSIKMAMRIIYLSILMK